MVVLGILQLVAIPALLVSAVLAVIGRLLPVGLPSRICLSSMRWPSGRVGWQCWPTGSGTPGLIRAITALAKRFLLVRSCHLLSCRSPSAR